MADAGQVAVTPELLAAGQSERGGWSRAQFALIGVTWPPPSGWKATVVGRPIPRADAEPFVALRGGGLPAASGGLFGSLA